MSHMRKALMTKSTRKALILVPRGIVETPNVARMSAEFELTILRFYQTGEVHFHLRIESASRALIAAPLTTEIEWTAQFLLFEPEIQSPRWANMACAVESRQSISKNKKRNT